MSLLSVSVTLCCVLDQRCCRLSRSTRSKTGFVEGADELCFVGNLPVLFLFLGCSLFVFRSSTRRSRCSWVTSRLLQTSTNGSRTLRATVTGI